jgi:membrane protein implicated in regulation of membrane protease activity
VIFAYLVSLAIAAAVFLLSGKLTMPLRLGLSLVVFLVLAVAVTVVLKNIGDPAADDAITVDPKQLQQHAPNEQ